MVKKYPSEEEQIKALNENFKRFLDQRVYGGEEIPDESGGNGIIEELLCCMQVDNFNVFSNTSSANNFKGDDKNPHKGILNADILIEKG